MKIIKKIFFAFARLFISYLCKKEFVSQKHQNINERPVEYSFLLRELTKSNVNTILDVGTGITSLPHLLSSCGYTVTAIDNISDYWPKGMFNRHFHILNDNIINPKLEGRFDLISCVSVLEHITDHRSAMCSMYDLLVNGGHCICTFPYNENRYSKNVYEEPGSVIGKGHFPFVTQAFSNNELMQWLEDKPWEIIIKEYWKYFDGDYWTVGSRLNNPVLVSAKEKHQLCCIHLLKK